jgi:peptidoglycan/LPS O-acetylase OafA/YrhL
MSVSFRPEIDGLRAVAVTAVIMFHAAIPLFAGGFLGVDIFFVLSGFLVGGSVIEALKAKEFSFLEFYARRARRIFPALFAMLLATFGVAWFILPPIEMKLLSEGLGTSSLFLSNFYYMTTTGYFGPDAGATFLLHTWSLSVEEQFYILFPILAFALYTALRKWIIVGVVCLAFGSFFLAISLSQNFPGEVFYFSPARAWQLLLGTVAAGLTLRPSSILSVGAVLLIVIGLTLGQDSDGFPDMAALIVSLGTAAFLIFTNSEVAIGRILSIKPILYIGAISYSLYLWHQPVFVYARVINPDGGDITGLQLAIMLAITFVFAASSYHFIEQPFRRRIARTWRPSAVLAAYAFPLIALFFVGLVGFSSDGFPSRVPDAAQFASAVQLERSPYRADCNFGGSAPLPVHPVPNCFFESDGPSKATVFVVGDSHADSLGPALIRQLNGNGFSVYLATAGGCLPVPNVLSNNGTRRATECEKYTHSAFGFATTSQIDVVVLVGRWSKYLEEGIPEDIADGISQQIAELGLQVPLILVDPIPEMEQHVPRAIIERAMRGIATGDVSIQIETYLARNELILEAFDSIASNSVVRVLAKDVFCDKQSLVCFGGNSGEIFYRDDNHLSYSGASILSQAIAVEIEVLQEKLTTN